MNKKEYTFNLFDNNSKTFFKKNGFIILKNFFKKKDVINAKKEILKNIKEKKKFFYYEKINNGYRLRRIEKISDFSKKSKKIIFSKKIFDILYKLKKKKFVLFKDKLNFKYPGGQGYLPHIDGHFFWKDKFNIYQKGWQKYSKNFINFVLPLEKSNLKNGCIYLSKKNDTKKIGSNFDKITKNLIINTPNIKTKDIKKFKFYPIILEAGDICFFDWKCAHYSKKNLSKNSRIIFYATYCEKNKKINIRKNYYMDKYSSKNNLKNKSLLFN
jgi:2-aminoethylphosphonate dioxygenase